MVGENSPRRWNEKAGLRRDALSSQLKRTQGAKRRPAMKKHNSKQQDARKDNQKASKETKEKFAFHIGMDLGDKNADVCVLDPDGEVSEEFRLPMKGSDFQAYFVTIARSRVALEA